MAFDTDRNGNPTATIMTPRGRASWPRLIEPDTKFKKEGEFSIGVVLPADEAQEIIDLIDELHAENLRIQQEKHGKPRKKIKESDFKPYVDELDEEGEETGNVIIRFKTSATWTNKKGKVMERRVHMFDARGKPCRVDVGGGSTVIVRGTLSGYYTALLGAGVTLYLDGVQILELKEFGEKTAAAMGFKAQDGYSADEYVSEEGDDDGVNRPVDPEPAPLDEDDDF